MMHGQKNIKLKDVRFHLTLQTSKRCTKKRRYQDCLQ